MINLDKKVVAVLSDLMFTVKILDAAKRAGLTPVFVKSQEDALAQAKDRPAAIIIDLNYGAADPLALISTLKANEGTRSIPLIGFVSHVQIDLRQAAQEKGCDMVVARSVFSEKLPELLAPYANVKE